MQLTYFPLRGLGEMCRLALSASGSEWEDTAVDYAEMKADVDKFHFAQVPMLKDGDFILTQTYAIMRYIGRTYEQYGASKEEMARIDEFLDGMWGIRMNYVEMVYNGQYTDEAKKALWNAQGLPSAAPTSRGANWSFLSRLLKKNSPDGSGFVVGSKFSIADACLMDLVELYIRAFPDEMPTTYPEFSAYLTFISGQPGIKEYIASGKRPTKINNHSSG